jgi:hypothetical protein
MRLAGIFDLVDCSSIGASGIGNLLPKQDVSTLFEETEVFGVRCKH